MEAAKDVPYCLSSQGLLRCKLHTISDTGISVQPFVITKGTTVGSFIYPTFAPIAIPPPPSTSAL